MTQRTTEYETYGSCALQPHHTPVLRAYEGGLRGHRPQGHPRHHSDLLLALVAALTAVLVTAAVCVADNASEAASASRFDVAEHEVVYARAGDSLWAIAERQGGGADVPQLVSWIQEANGLSSPWLEAGEQLVVPVLGK